MSRAYPLRPIVGVGAIIFSEGRVLMARRGKPPGEGNWSVPGGALRLGETLEEACLREVLEETGLRVEIDFRCAVLDRVTRDEWERVQYHYVLIDFVCRPAGGELRPASDIVETRWVLLGEVDALTPMTRGTARVIGEAAQEARERNIEI